MEIRRAIQGKPVVGAGIGVFCILLAGLIIAKQFWPEKKANLSQVFYSDDDGRTWFRDSVYLAPPFDHNGKEAVIAEIYSYDDGSKEFCGYLAKYTPAAKARLEHALADAQKAGQPLGSVALYRDPSFVGSGTLVKKPGSGNSWVTFSDPRSIDVRTVRAPDGTVVDQVFVY
jgi:hypothetical protein